MMIQTVQRTLPVVSSAAATGYVAHVDKLLSQANSKLYRQGMNYHVSVNLAIANAASSSNFYQVFTLNKDHRTIGALRMARSIYNQAMKDELEIRPEVKSPWTDFKIAPQVISAGGTAITWPAMVNEGLLSILKVAGTDVAGVQAVRFSDAYLDSEITANDGDQRKFALVTDASGYPDDAWNVFTEYTNFLLNRADPDSAVETPAYGDASPVLTEMAELADKGDEPPYAWNNKILEGVGGSAQDQGALFTLQGTLSHDSVPTDFLKVINCEAPLGMVFIISASNMSTTNQEIIIKAKPGNYKGVKADRLYKTDKLLGF